jgi:thioredoxin 1
MGKIINANQEEFQEILDSEKNIILVDFWAEWCGPCRVLGPILEDVAEEVENITVVKVNVDENQELSAKYGIRNLPTVILIKDGQQIDKFVGLQNKDKIVEIINRHNTTETKGDES